MSLKTLKTTLLFIFLIATKILCDEVWVVDQITFRGNEALTRRELLERMTLEPRGFFTRVEFTFNDFARDLASIEALYRRRGYLNSGVKNFTLTRDSLRFLISIELEIYEGPLTRVDTILFRQNRLYSSQFLLDRIPLSSGDALDSSLLERSREVLQDTLAHRGHLFAGISFHAAPGDREVATVTFFVEEGPVAVAGTLEFFGLREVSQRVIERELTFSTGEVLSLRTVQESVRRVYNTALFQSVRIDPLELFSALSDTVEVPVLISVTEREMFEISGGGGYGASQGLYLNLELLYRNLFSLGHRIGLSAAVATRERGVELYYTYPRVLSWPGSFGFRAFVQRREQEALEGNFYGGNILYSLVREPFIYRSYFRGERPGWISEPQPTALYPSTPLRETLLFGAGITRDTRSSSLFPGLSSFLGTDIEAAGIVIPSGHRFFKTRLEFRLFLPLWGQTSVSSGFQTAAGAGIGSPENLLPPQERYLFELRGIWPLRGYAPDQILPTDELGNLRGGNLSVVVNALDLRIYIYRFLYGAFFVDGGGIWRRPGEFEYGDVRWSAGPGLVVLLPFAVARIDYGVPLSPFSSGRVHFSLGPP